MATERQSPDTIAAQSGFGSCAVTDIAEDPDAPDGLWCVASGNNANTAVRTTFPTPTGNPTVGADLQEFKTWVRQFNEAQAGTPDCRIELWENGVLIRAGPNTAVPDGGLLLSFTWDASELATGDGSLAECKVVGVKTGGSPSSRNTVDVGAVEWNVTYSAAVVDLAAVVSSVSTVAGAVVLNVALAGVSAGAATVAGAMSVGRTLAALTAGVSTVAAALGVRRPIAAAISAVSTAAGVLGVKTGLAALSSGLSTVAGTLALTRSLVGAVTGATSLSADVSVNRSIAAGIGTVATTSAGLTVSAADGETPISGLGIQQPQIQVAGAAAGAPALVTRGARIRGRLLRRWRARRARSRALRASIDRQG
ncbi:hypothetical protein LCGC14_2046960 [marine sediment metagenome]|uniref:Uncharacterized protein n=1 Tax=marine sediment metagenome TaxID=412755 RepID=A0A0F9EQ93_9ZZZZ